jgi:hypothetical protein
MEANAVCQPHGSRDKEIGGLGIGCSQQKETLYGVRRMGSRDWVALSCLPLPTKLVR